jgi:hypothetical protein
MKPTRPVTESRIDAAAAHEPEAVGKTSEARLENDPRFLRRVENARKSLRAGRGVRLEDVKP